MLARAVVLLVVHAIALRLAGFRGARDRLRPAPMPAAMDPRRAAWLVGVAARRAPYAVGCLPMALTLQWILAAQGSASTLRFGVRKTGEVLEAHAWVELDGVVLLDPHAQSSGFEAFEGAIVREGAQ